MAFQMISWLAWTVAAISAPNPLVNGASWAIRTRPVFLADWNKIISFFEKLLQFFLGKTFAYFTNGLLIPRQNWHQINNFTFYVQLSFGHIGHFLKHMNLCAPSDKCNIFAASQHIGRSQRTFKRFIRDFFNSGSVQCFWFEYYARILLSNDKQGKSLAKNWKSKKW